MAFTENGDVLEGTKTVRFYPCAGTVSFSLVIIAFSCNYEKYLWSFISAIEFRALDATISGDSEGTKEFDGVDDELLNKRSNEVICVSSSCIRCGIHDALYDDFAVWSRSCTKVVASRIVCCASIRNFQP